MASLSWKQYLTQQQQPLRHRYTKSSSDSNKDASRTKAAAWAWYERANLEMDPTRSIRVASKAACQKKKSVLASRFKAEAMAKGEDERGNMVWDCGSTLYDSMELQWFLHHLDAAFEEQLMERRRARSFSMPHVCSHHPLKVLKGMDRSSEEHKSSLKEGKAIDVSFEEVKEGRGMSPSISETEVMDVSLEEQLCLNERRPRSRSMSDYVGIISRHRPLNDERSTLKKPYIAPRSVEKEGKRKSMTLSKLMWPLRFIAKSFGRISQISKDEYHHVYHHHHHHHHHLH